MDILPLFNVAIFNILLLSVFLMSTTAVVWDFCFGLFNIVLEGRFDIFLSWVFLRASTSTQTIVPMVEQLHELQPKLSRLLLLAFPLILALQFSSSYRQVQLLSNKFSVAFYVHCTNVAHVSIIISIVTLDIRRFWSREKSNRSCDGSSPPLEKSLAGSRLDHSLSKLSTEEYLPNNVKRGGQWPMASGQQTNRYI